MPEQSSVQYVGGKSSSREIARRECVQKAIIAARMAKQGSYASGASARSAGTNVAVPLIARSTSRSYIGAVGNSTWIGPLMSLGAAAASTAFTDNLQTLIDQGTTECMLQQGYKPLTPAGQ